MTDNTQELDEILDGIYHAANTDGLNNVFKPAPKVEFYKTLILDWHNKQMVSELEARIAEIEHVADYTNGMTNQMFENLKCRIAELEAERNKLKEVK